jgi:regulator of CtrA degradation
VPLVAHLATKVMVMNDEMWNELHTGEDRTVAFAQRLANSETFKALFREGMTLVEETAAYLDGDGRAQSRALSRTAALTYATESMRLTTRLMQLASWLLLQRAVNEGEMSQEQAGTEKTKVKLDTLASSRQGPGWDELPPGLLMLIERSLRLQDRVKRLDDAIYQSREAQAAVDNPVATQLDLLKQAFGGR